MNSFLETLLDGFSVPLLILLVSAFRRDPQKRWLDFTTVVGYVVYVAIAVNVMELTVWTIPHTYDLAFLRADAALGFNPIAFADVFSRYWFAMLALHIAYSALPIMIGLAWVWEQNLTMRRAILLGGCLCLAFYALFPAVGPGNFDWARQIRHATAPLNCMPSMHLTWALLLAINARSGRLRIGLWVYAALMGLATLALREHYLVDLLAAVPYTLAVQALSMWNRSKELPRPQAARNGGQISQDSVSIRNVN